MSEATVIKVFLPKYQTEKFLYGHKRIEKESGKVSKTIISFYVLSSSNEKLRTNLNVLGVRGNDTANHNFELNLITDESGKIVKVRLNFLKDNFHVYLMHYNKNKFLNSYEEEYSSRALDEHFAVYLAQTLKDHKNANGNSFISKMMSISHNFLSAFAVVTSKILHPLALFFQNTVIYRHCCNWRQCLNDKRSKNGFFLLDFILGITFFLLMNHVQHSGKYFMISTEFMVNKLRALLETLDGSPVGLKLNVQLNNFLLSCFMYHVDLWWNFIRIVEPAIHYIFYPITMFGLMGFSFQCAMLCDVVTLITLHAHCFYIYAAMLYKLELYSIRSLLRIVLGRRLNVLKDRVESQSYTNRQLFLATLFFTTLLFLLPTIIIYYLVFASLRLLIYCLSYVLMSVQYQILTFPFYKYLRWLTGSYVDASNVSINFLSRCEFGNVEILEFDVALNSSRPWKKSVFVTEAGDQMMRRPLSIDTFAKFLVKGELMAFLPKI